MTYWILLAAIGGSCFSLLPIAEARQGKGREVVEQKAFYTANVRGYTGSQDAKSPRASSSQEAFEILKGLNERHKLLATRFPQQYYFYSARLRPENCFGFVLQNGMRLVGESSGDILCDGKVNGENFVGLGYLYSEADLLIGGRPVDKGSYGVYVTTSNLLISPYDDPIGAIELPLTSKIQLPTRGVEGKKLFFAFSQEKGNSYLTLEGNAFPIKVR